MNEKHRRLRDIKISMDEPQPSFAHNVFYAARQAIRRHASGGNILIAATVLAMLIANIPAINSYYFDFWNQEVRLQVGSFNIFSHNGHPMSMLSFINDALMAIFFFSIGLEIKREILVGELSSFRQALLPILAAVGGMVVPVLIFMILANGSDYSGGAAIPMATDIAFSLGILAMLGSRVPISLKIFLTTLAVVDDIGGIIVIATCYSSHIEYMLLIYAAVLLGLLVLGQAMRIHPTIAGVMVAFCVPAKPVFNPKNYIVTIRDAIGNFRKEDDSHLMRKSILSNEQMDWLKQIESASDKVISPLQELEDSLHPFVNNVIVPLFAFANAGIYFLDMEPLSVVSGVSLAVISGLVVGKFVGIFFFSWLAVKFRIAPMPENADWKMMASVAMLGGIGFTVSLFIANLSFGLPAQADLLNHAKLGIVVGSVIAGVVGFMLLHITLPKKLCKNM